MPDAVLPDPEFARRCLEAFAAQSFMRTLGAAVTAMAPGRCEVRLPHRADLCQQDGFIHGGVVGAIADTACGFAAYSLMPAGSRVLTVEYKLNLMAPAVGEAIVARAEVIRAGRTLTTVSALVHALDAGAERKVAAMQATMIRLDDPPAP